MKKLMIAVAIVCAAVASQAATCVWAPSQVFDTYVYTMGSDYGTEYTGDMYLVMVTDSVTQDSLLKDLRNGGSLDNYTKATTIDVDAGEFSPTKFNTAGDTGKTYNFFAVIQDGDNIFLSGNKGGIATDMTDGTALTFDLDFQSGDLENVFGKADFTSGGWYNAAADVPEPTSGLLLLLGVAGLALKRKRA